MALPRLGSDYTDSLIDLVITSGFPIGPATRGPAENPAYLGVRRTTCARIRWPSTSCSASRSRTRGAPPVVTADNIQQLSRPDAGRRRWRCSRRPTRARTGSSSTSPAARSVGNRVLSFFPRGPLAHAREVSRYSSDLTPVTNAFSFGVEQKLIGDFSVSATYVHRRSHDLLTRRIVNLFPAARATPTSDRPRTAGRASTRSTYEGHIDYDGVAVALAKRYTHALLVPRRPTRIRRTRTTC